MYVYNINDEVTNERMLSKLVVQDVYISYQFECLNIIYLPLKATIDKLLENNVFIKFSLFFQNLNCYSI